MTTVRSTTIARSPECTPAPCQRPSRLQVTWVLLLLLCVGARFSAQSQPFPDSDDFQDHDSAEFLRGLALFQKAFTVPEGLGPEFNAVSCASCHNTPVVGGSGGASNEAMVLWAYVGDRGLLGGPTQRFAVTSGGRTVSRALHSRLRRRAPALFGIGYLEAIPIEQLRSRSDPFDADRDGISGRLPWRDECYGRFGWQSTVCDLEAFVTGALSREIGIEWLPRSRREIADGEMRELTAYVRGLPPAAGSASNEGQHLFERVLCSRCHTGVTGTANVTGNSSEVRAYTDLLIHEMGSRPPHGEQDSRTEFRTPALWGIAAIGPPFMHDGAAATVEEAILRHGGEAERSRRLFTSLSTAEKQQLLHFVQTR